MLEGCPTDGLRQIRRECASGARFERDYMPRLTACKSWDANFLAVHCEIKLCYEIVSEVAGQVGMLKEVHGWPDVY